jgi:hypothetical protein
MQAKGRKAGDVKTAQSILYQVLKKWDNEQANRAPPFSASPTRADVSGMHGVQQILR